MHSEVRLGEAPRLGLARNFGGRCHPNGLRVSLRRRTNGDRHNERDGSVAHGRYYVGCG